MNILLDAFTNRIWLYKPGNKKQPEYRSFFEPKSDLNSPVSCMHALSEFLTEDTVNLLKNDALNHLVLPDFPVAFGTFSLPILSRFKIRDVFETRFKLCYPNFQDYFLTFEEYHRGEEDSLFFYTVGKKDDIDALVSVFKKNGIRISGIDYFAHYVTSNLENKAVYPSCYLFVGPSSSEVVLCKGNKVLSISTCEYGEKEILNVDQYLESAYFYDNERSLKYASFVHDNFMTRNPLTDKSIDSADTASLERQKPRPLRMLKGPALEAYLLKNNIRKFCSYLNDVADYFAQDPWFIPISNIKIVSTDNFYSVLSDISKEYRSLEYEKASASVEELVTYPVHENALFKKTLKKERRTIDWGKFFSMSIGPKKKV